MVEIIIKLSGRQLGQLWDIGRYGLASGGYNQTEQFCIDRAVDEFIKKYWRPDAEEHHDRERKKREKERG